MRSIFKRPHIGDGCGPQGAEITPLTRMFSEACEDHDFDYTAGHDRAQAERDFAESMEIQANLQPLLIQPVYRLTGGLAATATGLFGWMFFRRRK